MKTIFKFLNFYKKYPSLIYLSIFLLLLPVALSIKFQHNDDWVYYLSIQNFLNGFSNIHTYIAATTYSQTYLGYFFALVFGVENLPVLTLFVSISAVYTLFKILLVRLKVNFTDSLLLSLFLLVNGIFLFTTIGFMTDNYFLLFLLLSVYFLYDSSIYSKETVLKRDFKFYKQIFIGILFVLLAYFTRQFGMLVPLALSIWLLIQRKYRFGFFYFGIFTIIFLYHFFLFPKSGEALETKFVFGNLIYFRYFYSLFSVILFYFAFFLMPIVFPDLKKIKLSNINWVIYIGLVIVTLIFNLYYFKSIWWVGSNDFGFKYIFQTKGFFVENIAGIKEGLLLSPFFVIRTLGRVVSAAFLISIFYFKYYKKFNNPFSILLILYLSTFFVIEKIYDRYLLPAFPLFLLAISDTYLIDKALSKIRRYFVIAYLIFLGIISYNFSADYILTNNYIWSKSQYLVKSNQIDFNSVTATDSWRYLYPRKNEKFKFTYDRPGVYNHTNNCELIDIYSINYPLQLFNNKIYLYKHKDK